MSRIGESTPGEELYDTRVLVLGESIKHHLKEEETRLFPKLRNSDLDLAALGAKMSQRKQALTAEMNLPQEGARPA